MRVMALEQNQENSRFHACCSTHYLRSTEEQVSAMTHKKRLSMEPVAQGKKSEEDQKRNVKNHHSKSGGIFSV